MNIRTMMNRQSVALYFALAYIISWGGIFAFIVPKFLRGETLTFSDTMVMFVPMLAGPTVASLIMTALVDGRDGLRNLFSRIGRWKVAPVWYAWAILPVPIVTLIVLGVLAQLVSPSFAPIINPPGIVFGLLAGTFEEIGWTGFAVPRLRARFSIVTTGIIVGALWGVWHLLAGYLGSVQTSGAGWLPDFLLVFFVPLIAYRTLMVWVYSRTGSVLVAILMHAFYTGTLYVVWPAASGPDSLLWKGLLSLGLWIVLAIVAQTFRYELTQQPTPEAVQRVKMA